ncbi:MAG: hypothetical protein IJV83_04135 [Clostridia bacterium]|nr:hypothetical protein [Clostridia bacterium]
MKNLKKWLVVMLSAVMAFATFGLVSCGDDTENSSSQESISSETDNSSSEENSVDPEELGTFYTLQEAYDNSYISHDNLQTIAELVNSNQEIDLGLLDLEDAETIKNLYSKQYDITNEDIIINFYGYHNDCVAVIMSERGAGGATVITNITVEGVEFIYPDCDTEVIIWKR